MRVNKVARDGHGTRVRGKNVSLDPPGIRISIQLVVRRIIISIIITSTISAISAITTGVGGAERGKHGVAAARVFVAPFEHKVEEEEPCAADKEEKEGASDGDCGDGVEERRICVLAHDAGAWDAVCAGGCEDDDDGEEEADDLEDVGDAVGGREDVLEAEERVDVGGGRDVDGVACQLDDQVERNKRHVQHRPRPDKRTRPRRRRKLDNAQRSSTRKVECTQAQVEAREPPEHPHVLRRPPRTQRLLLFQRLQHWVVHDQLEGEGCGVEGWRG